MASPSLRKMGGGGAGVEGNYASTNLFQSEGSSLIDDLGLTLFPGSQIPRVDERRDSVIDDEVRDLGRVILGDEVHKEPPIPGKLQGSDAISTVIECGEGNVEDHDFRRDDMRCHPSVKTTKPDDPKPCHPMDPGNGRHVLPVAARRPNAVNGDATGRDQAHPTGGQRPVRKDWLMMDNNLVQGQQSTSLGREYSRRIASASNLKNSGISAEESYDDTSLKIHPTSTTTLQAVNISTESTGSPRGTEELRKGSVVLTPSTLKPLAEFERSESLGSAVPNQSRSPSTILPRNSTASSSTLNTSSSSCQPTSRPRVPVSGSWTSHFPNASKGSRAKRYTSRPATSSAATSSLISHPHHHRVQIQNSPSTDVKKFQHDSTLPINQLPSLLDNSSSPFTETALKLVDCAPANSFESSPARHLRSSTYRRTKSLPNIIPTDQLYNMESFYGPGSSTLPTPPHETRSLSSGPLFPSVHFTPNYRASNQMHTANKVYNTSKSSRPTNASAHTNAHSFNGRPSMLRDQSAVVENIGSPSSHVQHHHLSNRGSVTQFPNTQGTYSNGFLTPGSQQPFHEAVYSNGNQTPMLQQTTGSVAYQQQGYDRTMPASQLYNGPGTGALNNGSTPSQSFSQSNPRDPNPLACKNIDFDSSLQNPMMMFNPYNNTLQQELEESQRQRNELLGRLQWHEQGHGFKLNKSLLSKQAQTVQYVAALERENAQLRSTKAHLLSEMQKFAGRPMTNECAAYSILQKYQDTTNPPDEIHHQRASLQSANLSNVPGKLANTLSEPITIDLTDEPSQFPNGYDNSASLPQESWPQAQPLPITAPTNLQQNIRLATGLANKEYEQSLNGTVPDGVDNRYPFNLGPDSHANRSFGPNNLSDPAKRSPKKTKDVINAAETLSPAQKTEIQEQKLASQQTIKRAKQAEYSKRSNEKKKAQEVINKQSCETSRASPSIQQKKKQPRSMAKIQKRAEQTRKPLAQVQRQVAQKSVDEVSQDKSTNDDAPASSHSEESTNVMEVDSLFGDDADPGPEDMEENDFNYTEYAAEIEAVLTADARAEVDSQSADETATNQGLTTQASIQIQDSGNTVEDGFVDDEMLTQIQEAGAAHAQSEENQGTFKWAVSPGHETHDFSEFEEEWRSK